MSNLLIDERPIAFLPMLAKALGSCERAIVLQQIHWLSRLPKSGIWDDDGLHWIWGTYDEWCKEFFPMWSPHTLRKHIQKLEKDGVLFSAQLRAKQHDRTKFYRINYAHEWLNEGMRPDAVDSMRPDGDVSNEPRADVSTRPDAVDSYIEQKTSSKTSQKKKERPTQGRKASNGRYTDPPPDDAPSLYSLKHHPNL